MVCIVNLELRYIFYFTVDTTTSASDVFRSKFRMECAWELDTPLHEHLIVLSTFVLVNFSL